MLHDPAGVEFVLFRLVKEFRIQVNAGLNFHLTRKIIFDLASFINILLLPEKILCPCRSFYFINLESEA